MKKTENTVYDAKQPYASILTKPITYYGSPKQYCFLSIINKGFTIHLN